MPGKTTVARAPRQEAVLLVETARFMRVAAQVLRCVSRQSLSLRRRLQQTEAFQRVDGLDEAQSEAVWDTAATLNANLERDIAEMAAYLSEAARKAERAARRRM